MDQRENVQQINENEVLAVGPILLLLRRLERMELVVEELRRRGIVIDDDVELANLKSSINHSERILRVRVNTNKDIEDVIAAAKVLREEVESIEQKQKSV